MNDILKICAIVIVTMSIVSCEDDDFNVDPSNPGGSVATIVDFKNDQRFNENSSENILFINFDRAASREGTIVITVESDIAEGLTTIPELIDNKIILTVRKGDTYATIKVQPVDNLLLDGEKLVNFEITNVSEGFELGVKNKSLVTILDDESPAMVGFIVDELSLRENEGGTKTVSLYFSAPAPGNGQITLQFSGQASKVRTEPAKDGLGVLELEVKAGDNIVDFELFVENNDQIDGHSEILVEITEVSDFLRIGEQTTINLTVLDDELFGKINSYETRSGSWREYRSYSYNVAGKVSVEYWEMATPGLRSGTESRYYAGNGVIERVNHNENSDTFYYQENDRVIKSETITDGLVKSYSLYDYDQQGNVGGMAVYYRDPNGEYNLDFINVYLYYENGNLYKKLIYIRDQSSDSLELNTTHTYSYIESFNPLPLEVLPGKSAQTKLLGTYRVETTNTDITYTFSYDTDSNGIMKARTASSKYGSERTEYSYY